MKGKGLYLVLSLLVALLSFSCDDDNDANWHIVPEGVKAAFSAQYPSARNIEWENKGEYKVAEFYLNNLETEAWFDSNGEWYMTETDLSFNALPQAVQTAFSSSEYGTWRRDDVDMFERKDLEVIYIIEVESQNIEMDLYYSAEGILVKVIEDYDNDNKNKLPQSIPSEMVTFINEKYPQSRIMETEYEHNRIEVDIIHNNIGKEVVFGSDFQWLYTSWETRIISLPQAVSAVINKPEYADYRIDDADFVETPQGNFYLLELEKGNSELNIRVDENGTVLS